MQELTPESKLTGPSVDRVAGDGQVDRPEMYADLMRPSGLEADVEERVAGKELDELEVGDGGARRIGVERVAQRVTPITSDRSLDPAAPGTGASNDESEVAALEPPPADESLEAAVRLVRASDDHQPGGVTVEPVDDAGPVWDVAPRDVVRQESLHEGPAGMPRRGMDDDSRGLVDHDEVVVLVGDAQLHRFGGKLRRLGFRRLEVDLLPALQPVALPAGGAVDPNVPTLEEALCNTARTDPRLRRQ